MSIFTICTAFVHEKKLEETLTELASSEKKFTRDVGVLFRKFFQCTTQPHIIWALTEWESEKHHHDAAQSLMKRRRDDRIASILFGPDPYFEVFCEEERELRVGEFSEDLAFIVVAHGLIAVNDRESFLKLRRKRIEEMAERLRWLSTYRNIYNTDEIVAFLGFADEESFNRVRQVDDLMLEEYLLTGIERPMGMSKLAGYNQFVCTPLSLTGEKRMESTAAKGKV